MTNGLKAVKRRIVFLTGTRADFGKIKSLLSGLMGHPEIEVHLFVTGMHMLKKYGYTFDEIEKCGYPNIYKYVNQNHSDSMDCVLAKTIQGFSDFVKEYDPNMIVVHGDRVEALAGALVGSLNNCLVAHIEGGEVSGTVDGLLRHAISKMSHLHFVANNEARIRLLQLGELDSSIFVIGSPDIDILTSSDLPSIETVRRRYEIPFDNYAILLFHPVTTELDTLSGAVKTLVDIAVQATDRNFVVIAPNNDAGSEIIFEEYSRFIDVPTIKMFPSMRFEYFLSLLRNAEFIFGNSSAGVREAPYYGVPCINIGTRQMNRGSAGTIVNVPMESARITAAIGNISQVDRISVNAYGSGDSNIKFLELIQNPDIWETQTQKYFVDVDMASIP